MKKLYLLFAFLFALIGYQDAGAWTIYFDNSTTYANPPYVHYWQSGQSGTTTAMTQESGYNGVLYSLTLTSQPTGGIILLKSNSTSNKITGDLTGSAIADGTVYKGSTKVGTLAEWEAEWEAKQEAEEARKSAFKVYFDNSDSNWPQPYIHYWGGDSKSTWGSLPAMHREGTSNIWWYEVPANTQNVLFNSANGDGGSKTSNIEGVIPNHVYNSSAEDLGDRASYVVLDPLPTKKWKITATAANPQVFLIGEWLNHSRVTPEYELKKGADGKYYIDPFMVVPSVEFKVRVFTSPTSYNDYSYNNATASPSDVNNTNHTWVHETYTGNGYMKLNLGYSMVSMTFENSGNHRLEVKLETDYPSTLSFAPIKGHPYVSIQGDATKPLTKFHTPNGHYNDGNKTTDTGWQEGWVQFDADGNVLVYDDGINCGVYGDGAVAGRALYNTIWPPRNPISFFYRKSGHTLQTASDDLRLKYIGVKKRSEAGTNDSNANSDNIDYAVYEATNIEMNGRYKIWSGWSGCNTKIGDDNSAAWWTSHDNWGFKDLDMSSSHSIETEEWYPMNGAGFYTNNGAKSSDKTDAGGNFDFDQPHLFSKVQLWYPLNGSDINNNAIANGKSYVITYLSVANPYISIRRSAKTTVTGDYELRNLPADGRNVSYYKIELIKEGNEGSPIQVKEERGSFNAKDIKGTVTNTDLETGRYRYRMYVEFEQSTVTYEPQSWETPWVRIYGALAPVITRAEQVTEKKTELGEEKTFYSFDIAVEANAPESVADMVGSYTITVPETAKAFCTKATATTKAGVETELTISADRTVTLTADAGNGNAMPKVVFKNVIPATHTIKVDMYAKDDDPDWPEDNVSSSSKPVDMVVPHTDLNDVSVTIDPNEDVTHMQPSNEGTLMHNVRHGHSVEHEKKHTWPLYKAGETEVQENGGYGYHISEANVITAKGALTQLMVTDGVLNDWDVTVTLNLQQGTSLDKVYDLTDNTSQTFLNADGNRVDISYLPVGVKQVSLAGQFTESLGKTLEKYATDYGYNFTYNTLDVPNTNYVVTTTYSRRVIESGNVKAPEPMNHAIEVKNTLFPAVETKFEGNHGVTLHSTAWQQWYDAHNVIEILSDNGNTDSDGALRYYGFFLSNGEKPAYYDPSQPEHKIYPGGHVLDCSNKSGEDNGYSSRFRVLSERPSKQHFGELTSNHNTECNKIPVLIGNIKNVRYDINRKNGIPDEYADAAKVEGVLLATYPIAVMPYGATEAIPTVDFVPAKAEQSYAAMPQASPMALADSPVTGLVTVEVPSKIAGGDGGFTTDIDDIESDGNGSFSVYPNPAVDVVTVEASAEIGDVEVIASSGATVLRSEISDTKGQLDVSALPAGLYLLRTDAGTTRLIVK
mgnify:FL=1